LYLARRSSTETRNGLRDRRINESLLTPYFIFYFVSNLLPQAKKTYNGNEPLIRPELRGSPVSNNRKAQEFAGGNVQGDSETSGFTTNEGQAASPTNYISTSTGNGSFDIKSGSAGFVDTTNGGAEGNAASGVSGTSSGKIADAVVNGDPSARGDFTVNSGSAADGKGSFIGGYSPDESANPTGGFGSGSGSAGVETSSAIKPIGALSTKGRTSNSAEAKSFGGGSSTGFNNLASAGGAGSGSAEGSASDIVASYMVVTFNGNEAATATFSGNGSGINGKIPNQPYTGGTVIGSGKGSGTAIVGGSSFSNIQNAPVLEGITGDAAFKSNGSGSGFVDGTLGNANGSASGGASGAASGSMQAVANNLRGELTFSGSSASNGNGAVVSGFSPSLDAGPTGGSGSGNGSLNVAGSGSTIPFYIALGETSGSGTAETFGGGSGSGSNTFGEAGGAGSGATTGSASASGGAEVYAGGIMQGTGASTSTGNFESAGSGSFGAPTGLLAFP
jgi:hypothetical protein